jgi:cytochrome c5
VSAIRALSASARRFRKPVGVASTALAVAACVSAEVPYRPLASGEQVYRQVCMACHATGVENAPRLGDRQAWKPLVDEGQDTLTAHAWVGVRGMPARGGQPGLSLEEFARATAYMARAAGGDWQDPDADMLAEIEEEIAERLASLTQGK